MCVLVRACASERGLSISAVVVLIVCVCDRLSLHLRLALEHNMSEDIFYPVFFTQCGPVYCQLWTPCCSPCRVLPSVISLRYYLCSRRELSVRRQYSPPIILCRSVCVCARVRLRILSFCCGFRCPLKCALQYSRTTSTNTTTTEENSIHRKHCSACASVIYILFKWFHLPCDITQNSAPRSRVGWF